MPNGAGTSMFYKNLTLPIEQNKCVYTCMLQVKFKFMFKNFLT